MLERGSHKKVEIPDDMESFASMLWESLNEENKVSLFVRYIDIATGAYETKIINKNQRYQKEKRGKQDE